MVSADSLLRCEIEERKRTRQDVGIAIDYRDAISSLDYLETNSIFIPDFKRLSRT